MNSVTCQKAKLRSLDPGEKISDELRATTKPALTSLRRTPHTRYGSPRCSGYIPSQDPDRDLEVGIVHPTTDHHRQPPHNPANDSATDAHDDELHMPHGSSNDEHLPPTPRP